MNKNLFASDKWYLYLKRICGKSRICLRLISIIIILLFGIYKLNDWHNSSIDIINKVRIWSYELYAAGEEKNLENDSNLNYLIFEDSTTFRTWHNEVIFIQLLPKYARNLSTDKVSKDVFQSTFINMRKHPNKNDPRVYCSLGNLSHKEFIDSSAQRRYKFVRVSHKDLEDLGFVNDNVDLISEDAKDVYGVYGVPSYVTNDLSVSRTTVVYPEWNFEFRMKLKKIKENRNAYISDLGSDLNRNRISIFLDNKDRLCFRVIDKNSKAYTIRLNYQMYDSFRHYTFKFARSPRFSYLEVYINGILAGFKHYDYEIPIFFKTENLHQFIGASLEKSYFGKLSALQIKVFQTLEDREIVRFFVDMERQTSIYYIDDKIFAVRDSIGYIYIQIRNSMVD